MLGSKTQPHIPQPTGTMKGDFQAREDLEGLQWGKSGLEMDEDRKEKVNQNTIVQKVPLQMVKNFAHSGRGLYFLWEILQGQ